MPAASKLRQWGVAAAAALLTAGAVPHVSAAEIDPQADILLRRMSDTLAGLQSFSVETTSSTELLMRNGQKIELDAAASGVFDRTRGFRFRRIGPQGGSEIAFDGHTLNIYAANLHGYHATIVEGGNDAALDEARQAFGTEAAGGIDLLYTAPYEGLFYEIEEGAYIGETAIDGVRAHHLAFRAAHLDWQIWISAEGDPLPVKYVITSKWLTAAPNFTVRIRKLDPTAAITEADLKFTPPDGSKPIKALRFDALGVAQAE